MFYFYGRRKQIAMHYPQPIHGRIVEPFAGAAAYALHDCNWEKDVLLIDISPTIAGVWQYLLQATVADIRALPDIQTGQCLDDYQSLSKPEQDLIGYCINPGCAYPRRTATKANRWPAAKTYITAMVERVKHWNFIHGNYELAPNTLATWFIDPPFIVGGEHYRCPKIDYQRLGRWCRGRQGQVIVCENGDADWLPFRKLGVKVNNGGLNGAKRKAELIWTNTS